MELRFLRYKTTYNRTRDVVEGFILGMKPQKIREFSFTNGVETIRCSMEQAPEGYTLTRYFKKV